MSVREALSGLFNCVINFDFYDCRNRFYRSTKITARKSSAEKFDGNKWENKFPRKERSFSHGTLSREY